MDAFTRFTNEFGSWELPRLSDYILSDDTKEYLFSGYSEWKSWSELGVQAVDTYRRLMALGDKRVAHWPLMATPWPTVSICLFYILGCIYAPQHLQHPKRPSTAASSSGVILSIMTVYNAAIIGLNAYIAYELAVSIAGFSWICEPVNYSDDVRAMRIASALWWYYMSKCFEMADSLFFVLRGKFSQLTFLHVYHHSTMFALWWIGVKYVAGGSSVFGAMFNAGVHVLMYSYYLATSLKIKWVFPLKQYLTMLQIGQFALAMAMGINAIRVGCSFPLWMQYAMVGYMVTFLALFSNFYIQTYKRRASKCNVENGNRDMLDSHSKKTANSNKDEKNNKNINVGGALSNNIGKPSKRRRFYVPS